MRLFRCALFPAALACAVQTADAAAQAGRDSVRADSIAHQLTAVTITESRAVGVAGGASAVLLRPGELRTSPAPQLAEALRESPFVHVRQNSRGEMELSVRGSDSRQAAVLVDGVPITAGWDHRTDPSLVPLTGSQSLVIVRGLGTLLNGPNTLGGTIEVSHDDSREPEGARVWGGFGIDDNSAYVASTGASRRLREIRGGALSLRGGLAHRQRDGIALSKDAIDPTASNGLRTNSDLRQTDAFASIRWTGALGRGFGATISGFNAERGVPPEEHIGSPRLWRYPYNTRALLAVSAKSGSFETPFGYATLDLGGGYNTGRFKIEAFDDRSYTTVAREELGNERTWSGRVFATHTLPGDATLKVAATVADVRYTETLSPEPGADYRQTMISGGGEVEARIANATTVAGGVVFDRSATPETGGRTPGQEPLSKLGWRAGVTRSVGTDWRLHASASQRARFPALRELYSGALDRFVPNPALKPETLLGVEGGFTVDTRLGPIPSATLQLTGFRHNLDDAVVRITLSNPTRFMRVNQDRIESTGLELMAGVLFGTDRERSVSLTGDATVQRIVVRDATAAGLPGRRAENNPERRGTLELGLPLPLDLRGIASSRYTGTQFCLNADSGAEMRLDGRTEGSLALERKFEVATRGPLRWMRVLTSLDNVTDATVFDQCGLPQPGRTFRVMVTFR